MNYNNNFILEQYFMRRKKPLSERTKGKYIIDLRLYSKFNKMSLNELIEEAKIEQRSKIVNNIIIEPDIENSKLAQRLYSFVMYERNKGLSDLTIQTRISNIRAFYKGMGVKQLPSNLNFESKTKKIKLKKEKIIRSLNYANNTMQDLIIFMTCTGFRIGDCTKLIVNDQLKALGLKKVKDLLKIEPDEDLIGYWEIIPNKTKKTERICKVCNTPQSNRSTIRTLKHRYDTIGLNKEDPLFMNQIGNPYSPTYVAANFKRIDKLLYFDDVNYFKHLYENGKIDKYSYEYEINNISKFHSHALRSFFISQISNHCGNLKVVLTMEGHRPIVPTDKHYVEIYENTIREEYFKLIPYLSLEKTEVNVLTDERIKIYEDKLKQNEIENKERDLKLEKLEKFVNGLDKFNFDLIKD